MAVWDRPGRGEDRLMFDKLVRSADIDPSTVFETHMIRCDIPRGRQPRAAEVAACKRWLWDEIVLIGPAVILCLGRLPTRLLLREKCRFDFDASVGKPHKPPYCNGTVVVPIYHPSTLMRGGIKDIECCVLTLRKCGRLLERCSLTSGSAS